ncbi:MAG: hypothetical protein AAF367_08035 [Pseudomonadota bacterium]
MAIRLQGSPTINDRTFKCGLIKTDAGVFALPESGWAILRDTRTSMLEKLEQGKSYKAVFLSPPKALDRDGKFHGKDGRTYSLSPPATITRLVAVND